MSRKGANQLQQQRVTQELSVRCIQNTLKTSLSCILYLRGCFDEECFEDKTIGGIRVKNLKPTCENMEAHQIYTWIEEGLFDAINKEYLKSVVFSIYNLETDKLMETYVYSFRYDNLMTTMNVERQQGENMPSEQTTVLNNISKNDVKEQTIKFLKSILSLTSNLEPLPEKKYMAMQLLYFDDKVPQDYEPPHFSAFQSEKGKKGGEKEEESHQMTEYNFGEIDTGYHNMSVILKKKMEEEGENGEMEGGEITEEVENLIQEIIFFIVNEKEKSEETGILLSNLIANFQDDQNFIFAVSQMEKWNWISLDEHQIYFHQENFDFTNIIKKIIQLIHVSRSQENKKFIKKAEIYKIFPIASQSSPFLQHAIETIQTQYRFLGEVSKNRGYEILDFDENEMQNFMQTKRKNTNTEATPNKKIKL